jgi:heme A synthase
MPPATPVPDRPVRSGVSVGFRRLAWSTLGMTFLLVLIGGVVRVSDSGLGCGPAGSGLEGWPLCHGRLIPGVDLNHIVEYSHRTVASIVGFMIIAIVIWAYRRYRDQKAIMRLSLAALALVLFEGSLGGLTVEHDLHETLVAVHLGTAMLILGVLLALSRASSGISASGNFPGSVKKLAVAASVSVWATIVAGGYMAGTQKYGRADYELGDGAHLACGKEFPTCNGSFFPFGDSRLVDIHLIHRALIYLTVILVIALAVKTLRADRTAPSTGSRGSNARTWVWAAIAALVAQVALGGMNVWLGEHEELIAGHLMLGTLLWLIVLSLTLTVTGRPRVPQGGAPGNAAGG